jgi:hypothetical protein
MAFAAWHLPRYALYNLALSPHLTHAAHKRVRSYVRIRGHASRPSWSRSPHQQPYSLAHAVRHQPTLVHRRRRHATHGSRSVSSAPMATYHPRTPVRMAYDISPAHPARPPRRTHTPRVLWSHSPGLSRAQLALPLSRTLTRTTWTGAHHRGRGVDETSRWQAFPHDTLDATLYPHARAHERLTTRTPTYPHTSAIPLDTPTHTHEHESTSPQAREREPTSMRARAHEHESANPRAQERERTSMRAQAHEHGSTSARAREHECTSTRAHPRSHELTHTVCTN